jgi:aspartate/glutamate racemase
MPCNTLHALLPRLRKSYNIPFLDLIEEVSMKCRSYGKLGIICSSKTREMGLYNHILGSEKLVYPSLEDQGKISEIIIKIIRGRDDFYDKLFLENIIENMMKSGCKKVILACTDLANLIGKNEYCLDTADILIDSIIKEMKD